MPTKEQLRDRLLKKLKELFQLDQPDLDFGFYRIMHVKAKDVADFIDTDLLNIVTTAFGSADETRKAELQGGYEKALQTAKDFGAPNPEETEPVKKARAALDAIKDTASAEADVYDHLYRFFERYYDDGDFISRRYYARETAGKAAPFAIPYNGEEVKLHWANADQYYIKTAEYFANYSFDLTQAADIRRMKAEERILNQIPDFPVKVQFRIVDATEGEHGNVKAAEGQKRFFIINGNKPLEVSADGELVVNFEYRADPEKGATQEGSWRDKRNGEATQAVLAGLTELVKTDRTLERYLYMLQIAAPTDKDKTRPLLTKYINQYTARNSCDYFIHKDLGGFLKRELDFYIKNEVMRLDDIENADAPAVESYLSKIKVLRRIAGKLIDFLAQLENFQKKLWLKKKFVVETNYCITLDRLPEELYGEIAANEAQREEWDKLGMLERQIPPSPPLRKGGANLDLPLPMSLPLPLSPSLPLSPPSIKGDLGGFSAAGTIDYLRENPFLVLDTAFFDESFKERLIGSIEDFDEQCDGLLIHSENFQALNLLQERYLNQIKCVLTDPPYNTKADSFPYKDSYKHSSWITMMENRLMRACDLLNQDGCMLHFIDENEHTNASALMTNIFGLENRVGDIVWKNSSKNDESYVSMQHEYFIGAVKSKEINKGNWTERKEGLEEIYAAFNKFRREHGKHWKAIHKSALEWYRQFPDSNPVKDSKHYSWMDERGVYFPADISGPNYGQYRYAVIHPTTKKVCMDGVIQKRLC